MPRVLMPQPSPCAHAVACEVDIKKAVAANIGHDGLRDHGRPAQQAAQVQLQGGVLHSSVCVPCVHVHMCGLFHTPGGVRASCNIS